MSSNELEGTSRSWRSPAKTAQAAIVQMVSLCAVSLRGVALKPASALMVWTINVDVAPHREDGIAAKEGEDAHVR